jgi:type VI secretion system protein ImpF
MPELTPKERLQPSLLDRLSDNEPDRKSEAADRRVLGIHQLRESVRRDLAWLFNSTHLAASQNLDLFPEAAASTLNYGLPDLAGRTASGLATAKLEKLVLQAIWQFEPRLRRESVRVTVIRKEGDAYSHNAVVLSIDAELWAQPVPLRLLLRTDVDLESGEVLVTEASSGGG